MIEYATGILSVCAVVVICGFLVYRGKSDGATKFAFATLLVYVTLTPLRALVGELTGVGEIRLELEGGEYSEDYKEVAEEAFCEGVRLLVCSQFSLNEEFVRVSCRDFDFQKMRADRIKIILSSSAALADRTGIEKFINQYDIGRCECEIEIG